MKPAKLTMGFVVMAIFSSDLYALDRSIVKIIPITKSECAYAEPGKSLETHSDCLELLGNNQFKIRPEHLKKMDFSYANGLAALYYQGGTAYVSPKGKIARTFTFDNGPDYFVDGLARGIGPDGKMGFINHELNFVIPPRFDFVTPFKNGKAGFCNGCYWESPIQEHPQVVGGVSGEIDIKGNLVSPIQNK